jgi:hypothetical protein
MHLVELCWLYLQCQVITYNNILCCRHPSSAGGGLSFDKVSIFLQPHKTAPVVSASIFPVLFCTVFLVWSLNFVLVLSSGCLFRPADQTTDRLMNMENGFSSEADIRSAG